jgi:hypothetical protein
MNKIRISKQSLREHVSGVIKKAISAEDGDFRVKLVEQLRNKNKDVKKVLRETVSKIERSYRFKEAIKQLNEILEKDPSTSNKLSALQTMMAIRLNEKDDPSPHRTTGINVLEDLLKKIIPVIEKDYKMLTTDKIQRDSYRAHIINALETVITSENLHNNIHLPDGEEELEQPVEEPKPEMNMKPEMPEPDMDSIREAEELKPEDDLNNNGIDDELEDHETSSDDEDKFIDVADLRQRSDMRAKKEKEDVEYKMFSIGNHDETGRNVAFKTFKKIQTQIVDQYNILADERDRELFFDYLLANVKLYFDRFEEEISMDLPEPTNDEYEDAVEQGLDKSPEEPNTEEPEMDDPFGDGFPK